MLPNFSLQELKGNETKVLEEYCWVQTCGDGRGMHSAGYQVQVCWSLDFSCTPLYIHIYLTICTLSSDLHNLWLVLDCLECNYCISQGVSAMSVLVLFQSMCCCDCIIYFILSAPIIFVSYAGFITFFFYLLESRRLTRQSVRLFIQAQDWGF
jgi:hypothetical protein